MHNDIVKPFRIVSLQYAERVREIHYLANSLPPTSMIGYDQGQLDWSVCDKEISEYDIRVETKDELPTCMQDEM